MSGLCCARRLREEGHDVVVLESADHIGGRVTSEEVDGFVVDRGFQVLNPAYPHLRRAVDLTRVGLRSFPRSVRVSTDEGITELTDPSRRPSALASDLASGLVGPRDVAGLLAVVRGAVRDEDRRTAFDRAGFTGPLRHRVVDPFLAGVVCERDGSTSARFTAWLLGTFMAGTPGLPSGGMRTLPRVLAEGLDVRTGRHVVGIDSATATVTTDEGELSARALVLACGPLASADLLGTPTPKVHATTTHWFAMDQAPSESAAIHVDGTGEGPVTTTVVSRVAPEYAPAGQHLVAALTLAGEGSDAESTRSHCGRIYGTDTSDWRLVASHEIACTVPAVEPGASFSPTIERRNRLVVAGDHLGNASLDGAAASGQQAARRVAEMLG